MPHQFRTSRTSLVGPLSFAYFCLKLGESFRCFSSNGSRNESVYYFLSLLSTSSSFSYFSSSERGGAGSRIVISSSFHFRRCSCCYYSVMNSSVRKGRLEPWCPITQLEHSGCDSISLPIFGHVIDRPARVADKYTLLNVSNNIFVGKHPFTRLTMASSIKFFAPGLMLFGNGGREIEKELKDGAQERTSLS